MPGLEGLQIKLQLIRFRRVARQRDGFGLLDLFADTDNCCCVGGHLASDRPRQLLHVSLALRQLVPQRLLWAQYRFLLFDFCLCLLRSGGKGVTSLDCLLVTEDLGIVRDELFRDRGGLPLRDRRLARVRGGECPRVHEVDR
jgi:hypothetical protein